MHSDCDERKLRKVAFALTAFVNWKLRRILSLFYNTGRCNTSAPQINVQCMEIH